MINTHRCVTNYIVSIKIQLHKNTILSARKYGSNCTFHAIAMQCNGKLMNYLKTHELTVLWISILAVRSIDCYHCCIDCIYVYNILYNINLYVYNIPRTSKTRLPVHKCYELYCTVFLGNFLRPVFWTPPKSLLFWGIEKHHFLK